MDVLLATHGRPELLNRTLTNVLDGHRAGAVERIVVVENGAPSGAREICENLGAGDSLIFLSTPIANKSSALNRGLSACVSDLIFMTDDDVEVSFRTLKAYSDEEFRGCGSYFGGPTKAVYEEEPEKWMKSYLPRSATGWACEPTDFKGEEYLLGFNWAAFRTDLIRVGGFDPNFGPGSATGATGQETNMQSRLREAGVYANYLPEALVTHYIPRERCNTTWMLERAFRRGVESGLRHATRSAPSARERLAQRGSRDALRFLGAIVAPTRALRFKERFWLNWSKGFRRGIWLVEQEQLMAPPFLAVHRGNTYTDFLDAGHANILDLPSQGGQYSHDAVSVDFRQRKQK